MKKIITLSIAVLLLAALGINVSLAAKPTGGGKGGKVTVESADPSSAIRNQVLEVLIGGSGLENPANVRFLVTGTDDGDKIEVISFEFDTDLNKLKAQIKVTGNAPEVGYDIEVQATSGRKGKGTTLFKVQKGEYVCTGLEPKEPTIVYKTETDSSGDVWTSDLVLSSASGCDQYILLEDAHQYRPASGNNDAEYIQAVWNPRLAIRNGRGLVSWRDGYQEPSVAKGILFQIDDSGNIYTEPYSQLQVYFSPVGNEIFRTDARIDEFGDAWIVMVERSLDRTERIISIYNIDRDYYEILTDKTCALRDATGDCFQSNIYDARWSPSGQDIFFEVRNYFSTQDKQGIARISWNDTDTEWSYPEFVFLGEINDEVVLRSVSLDDLMTYSYKETTDITNKRGKVTGTEIVWRDAIINPDLCSTSSPCAREDGAFIFGKVWTKGGSTLDWTGNSNEFLIDYVDPLNGIKGSLSITGFLEFDSSL